jgi:hypothetical protein
MRPYRTAPVAAPVRDPRAPGYTAGPLSSRAGTGCVSLLSPWRRCSEHDAGAFAASVHRTSFAFVSAGLEAGLSHWSHGFPGYGQGMRRYGKGWKRHTWTALVAR